MEHMILGTVVAENELSDVHRSGAKARNENITTGIIGEPIIVDESPSLVKYEESGSEGEKHLLRNEVNDNDIDRERTVVSENVDEEE